MTNTEFNELSFSALSEYSPITTNIVKMFCTKNPTRILDLGCGTGKKLLEIKKAIPNVELTGIDISIQNIKIADEMAKQNEVNISLHKVDYLSFETEPFDIIYADSVLHLITAPNSTLYAKLANDLKSKGKLIITIPYDCLYNRILNLCRRVLKNIRNKFTDRIILKIAKICYPTISTQALLDRIPYMYIIPQRMDSIAFRDMFKNKFQLSLIESKVCKNLSLAKLKHKLIIFEKN